MIGFVKSKRDARSFQRNISKDPKASVKMLHKNWAMNPGAGSLLNPVSAVPIGIIYSTRQAPINAYVQNPSLMYHLRILVAEFHKNPDMAEKKK